MKKRLATEVRAFAADQGYAVGTRGRLSTEVFGVYLSAQKPAKVREIAANIGVQVPAKGRISEETLSTIASALR